MQTELNFISVTSMSVKCVHDSKCVVTIKTILIYFSMFLFVCLLRRFLSASSSGYSSPTVQILATLPPHQDPASPHLLVCLLTGLSSPVQNILWWVNDRMEMSTGTAVTPDGSGTYSASSVWELSAADWRSRSTYWCGTVQAGRVYRQRLCPQNRVCLDSHTRFTNRACQRF